MSGFFDTLSDISNSAFNRAQDADLSPQQLRGRNIQKQTLEILKVACVVASVVSAYFFVLNPTPYLFFKAAVAIGAFTEIYKVCDNFLECFTKAFVRIKAENSDKTFIRQLGKNTYVIGPLLNVLSPCFLEKN